MVGVGIFTLGVGKFELDLTSYLFYKCNTVVPLYCSIIRMVGGLFCFSSVLILEEVQINTECY